MKAAAARAAGEPSLYVNTEDSTFKCISPLDSSSQTLRCGHAQLSYPELNRKLQIDFEKTAPFRIRGWQEIDLKNPANSTSATIIKTLKLPYWQLNHNGDERYRDSLELN